MTSVAGGRGPDRSGGQPAVRVLFRGRHDLRNKEEPRQAAAPPHPARKIPCRSIRVGADDLAAVPGRERLVDADLHAGREVEVVRGAVARDADGIADAGEYSVV